MITARINGFTVKVPEGTTILDAARKAQIKIPTLCQHPDLPSKSSCGICIVKAKGINKMLRACCTPIEKDMDIITHDEELTEIRRTVLELILSKHPNECLTCARNHFCELQQLTAEFGIREESFPKIEPYVPYDDSTKAITVDRRKCILCGRCVDVCQKTQSVWALSFLERGINARVAPAGDITLNESPCVRCGQCSAHCPTGAIVEHDDTAKVWKALQDPEIHCVIQIAPAVRVAVGDLLGYPPGTNLTHKLYAAFRRLGFDAVFDTNFGADVTIMEEGSEFVERFTKHPNQLPLLTSCCPAWVDFVEKYHHDMVQHLSSCKSPHQIVGALAKTYYAKKMRHAPEKIFVVSIMPCTAKKYEVKRTEISMDIAITTSELVLLLKESGFYWDKSGKLFDKFGHRVEFNLVTNAGNTEREAIGVMVKQDLEDLGMKVNFKPIEFNSLVNKLVSTLDWDMVIMGFTGSPLEPNGGKNVWLSDGTLHVFNMRLEKDMNSKRFDFEKRIDYLFTQGALETDFHERKKYYDEYQEIVYNEKPMIYIYSPLRIYAIRNKFKNVFPSSLGGITYNLEEIFISKGGN